MSQVLGFDNRRSGKTSSWLTSWKHARMNPPMIRYYPIFIVAFCASLFPRMALGGLPAKPIPDAFVRMDRLCAEVCEFSETISTFRVLLEDYRHRVNAGQISSEEANQVLSQLSNDLNARMYAQANQAADVVAARRRLDRPVRVARYDGFGPPSPYDLTDEVIAILNAQALP